MNRAKRFFGRKSVRKLLEESMSNRTDEDNFPGYSDEHLPDFSFPDPIDPREHPTLATNRETHLSQRVNLNRGKCEMKLRCSWSTVNKWWKAMVAKGECFASIRNQILESPFGSLFLCGYTATDRTLAYALIQRWWDTTHTFHFPQGEIGITPLDVTMLTGMSIGSGKAVTFGDDSRFSDFEYAQRLWPTLTDEYWVKGGIRPTFFVNEFIELTMQADDGWCPLGNDRDTYVRAFYFHLVTQCFFPTSDNSLRLGWVECLEDLGNIYTYDWGGSMFAALIFAMDQACRPKSNAARGQCGGFTPLLQYWWFEYVPLMAPLLNADTRRDIVPRMKAWAIEGRLRQPNQGKHNLHMDRNSRSDLAINWTPWLLSIYMNSNLAEVDNLWTREVIFRASRVYHLSQCRVVFEYEGMVVWYLGDRCWHQIFGTPLIPHPPPGNMRPFGGASPWRSFLRDNPGMWPLASNYVHAGGDYDRYWDLVSRGPILPPGMYIAGNMDFVGHRGIRDDVRIPHLAEPDASSQGPYEAFVPPPFDPDNQWRYGMVTSQGMRVDVPIPRVDPSYLPTLAPNFDSIDEATVRGRYAETLLMMQGMRDSVINETQEYYNHLLTERRRSEEMQRRTQELEQELGPLSFRESRRSRKSRKHGEGTSGS